MIVLGRISAPFGIRGWVKVHVFGGDPHVLGEMPQWWLCADDAAAGPAWRARTITGWRLHGKGLAACLEGVADRTAAENLAGLFVGAPREALPSTKTDEYYWADLIGLHVVNQAGESLGRVDSLIATGAHDVLCVRDGDGIERLLPCVAAIVKKVDMAGQTIRVAWERDW